jgi:hypothetical protein
MKKNISSFHSQYGGGMIQASLREEIKDLKY